MGDERDVAAEVAAYLREVRDEMIDTVTDEYDRRYEYSRGYTLPREVRDAWTSSFIDGVIADLEGDVDSTRYETCGGDMVLMHEKSIIPIATYLEAELFHARIVSAFVWRRWLGDRAMVKRANEAIEKSICASMRANLGTFLDRMCQPGTISTMLSLDTPNGPWVCDPVGTRSAMFQDGADAPSPAPGDSLELTGREREVLGLVVEGLANKEIAARLDMGLSTVKKHVGRLFEKFGVQSRAELVARALK